MAVTLCDTLSMWAEKCPEKEAYVIRNPPHHGVEREAVTFAQLEAGSHILAQELRLLGLKPGDRVVILGKNCPEWLYVAHAAMKARLVSLYLYPDAATPAFLRACAEKYHARAFVVQPDINGEFSQGMREAFPSCFTTVPGLHGVRPADTKLSLLSPMIISMTRATKQDVPSVKEMMTNNQAGGHMDKTVLELPKPEDLGYCLATSGSTGDPKFVVHTHNSIVNWVKNYSEMLTKDDPSAIRYFSDRSFAWAGSFYSLPVVVGATYICTNPEYTTKLKMTYFVRDILREESICHTLIIPYLLYDIINSPDGDQGGCLKPLETVLVGGERVQKELLEKAIRVAPNLCMAYGMTEAGALLKAPISTDDIATDVTSTSASGNDVTRVKYVVHPRVQLRVLNPDEDGCGEIQIRGSMLFSCYLDNPETNRQAMTSDGWFSTGDVGCVLPDGRVYILGRCKNIISCASRKFYPIEFERVLSQHPKVEKCVVVGVPDPRLYEEICGVVIPKQGEVLTETELHKYSDSENFPCKPRYFVFMEKFPLCNDKIDRGRIRGIAMRELGLQEIV